MQASPTSTKAQLMLTLMAYDFCKYRPWFASPMFDFLQLTGTLRQSLSSETTPYEWKHFQLKAVGKEKGLKGGERIKQISWCVPFEEI